MTKATQTVSVSFRLLKLDMMQAYTFKKEINGASFYKRDNENNFVGTVPLSDELFDELNDFVIRQQIQYNDCDIYVESTVSASSTGIEVPRVVNRMLKYIDCKLSYGIISHQG